MKAVAATTMLGLAVLAMTTAFTACSSGTGGHAAPDGGGGGGSSGGGASSSGGAGGDSGSDATSSGGGSSGGAGSSSGCKADPTLHPGTPGQVFCGFTDAGSFDCPTGQQCCLGGKEGSGFAPEACATFGETCSNGTGPIAIECQQPEDCTANGKVGAVCCLQGGSPPAAVAGCDAQNLKTQGGTAIVCEVPATGDGQDGGDGGTDAGSEDASADGSSSPDGGGGAPVGSCAFGEIQVCETASDCPTGKTCTPTRWKLYEIGLCL